MRKLSDEEKIEIVKKYQNGLSSIKLGKEYNVSPRSILSILKIRKITMRGRNGK
jgi:transposase-like protein